MGNEKEKRNNMLYRANYVDKVSCSPVRPQVQGNLAGVEHIRIMETAG